MAAAGRAAMGALLSMGKSRLTALVGGHVASFGDVCWQTDSKLAYLLRRPDGRSYHPESVARVRRQLRDDGIITSERRFVGDKIEGAKFRSSRGTTVKRFLWNALQLKNPFSRRQRQALRMEQARRSRDAGEAMAPRQPRPQHSALIEQFIYKPAAVPDVRRSGPVPGRVPARTMTSAEIDAALAARDLAAERAPPDD